MTYQAWLLLGMNLVFLAWLIVAMAETNRAQSREAQQRSRAEKAEAAARIAMRMLAKTVREEE